MKELIGALVAGSAALLYDAGFILEKQALTDLPPVRPSPASIWRTARASRRWVAGFVAMLSGLALQVVALTLAPVSVVQPILAGGLIALAAAGTTVLGERLTARHAWALGLVLVAVGTVAVSAHGGGSLARSVPAKRFLWFTLGGLATAGAAAWAGLGRGRLGRIGPTAAAAGLLYGLGAVAEKAISTRLVGNGIGPGAVSSLATPYPWLFAAATFAGMLVFQVGLQAHPASLMASLSNVTSTVCALLGAAFVFDEALLPPGWWAVLRLAGLASVLVAVMVLAADRDPDAAKRQGQDRTRPDHAVAP